MFGEKGSEKKSFSFLHGTSTLLHYSVDSDINELDFFSDVSNKASCFLLLLSTVDFVIFTNFFFFDQECDKGIEGEVERKETIINFLFCTTFSKLRIFFVKRNRFRHENRYFICNCLGEGFTATNSKSGFFSND